MGEQSVTPFDRATEEAWTSFRARLADHVAAMADDDVLVVHADAGDEAQDGAAPYVQFCAWGDTLVRGEVSSNEFLATAHRLDDDAVAALVGLGWSAPTHPADGEPDHGSANFHLDVERVEADRLAVMTVRVLREVFGVLHPSFLAADGLETDPAAEVPVSADDAEASDEPLATMPGDRDDLQALVDAALTPYFGHPPKKDSDGDIPVVTDTTVVYVRVLSELPVVHLFCRLVREVDDLDAARFETGVLNRDGRFVRYSVVGDAIMAEVDVPALPFAPGHLRDLLHVICNRADTVVDDLVQRVGGRRELDSTDDPVVADLDDDADEAEDDDPWLVGLHDEDDEDVGGDAEIDTDATHPAMQTLLELEADRPGSVTPEMAASVCAWDRDLVLELISWNSSQETAWRRARDRADERGDADEAEVCEGERAQAQAGASLLRRALRLVVEAQVARHRFTGGYAGSGQRGRAQGQPDVSLPGLDVRPAQEPGLFEARPSWLEGGRA